MKGLAAAALGVALGCLVTGAQEVPRSASIPARFHHVHYTVGDPAAAMGELVGQSGGVRVVAQGLGVGVRTDGDLVLFDRGDTAAWRSRAPAGASYGPAADALKAWGFSPTPLAAIHVRAVSLLPDLPADHLAFAVDDLAAAAARLAAAGATVVSHREDALLVQGGAGLLIEIVRETDREEVYWCPMHPDVRSAAAAKCSICAMELVPIPPPRVGEYGLDVAADRDARSGTIRRLRFAVREPGTHARVEELLTVHERTFHLFVVSRDLGYFAHEHPERLADGTYELRQALPRGEYMLIADFLPRGGTAQMVQRAVISGRAGSAAPPEVESADRSERTVTKDGLTVTLDAAPARAGREVLLTFTVTDPQSGRPVEDLEPYLGAPAHMLLVRTDLSDAVHVHPEEAVTGGPTVTFHPLLPSEGAYKLWIQLQRRGRVVTVPFVIRTGT